MFCPRGSVDGLSYCNQPRACAADIIDKADETTSSASHHVPPHGSMATASIDGGMAGGASASLTSVV